MSFLDFVFGSSLHFDNGCDWICDNCGAHMNGQPGFDCSSGEWTCCECGYINDVSENNIRYDDDDDDDYDDDDYDDDDDDDEYDEGEGLSVDEAARIWLSNGMDEDYTFGYTEEELEEALKS